MPSSLSYLFYSLLISVVLFLYLLYTYRTKGWIKRKKQLVITILLFFLLQSYFWNTEFNQFLKSFFFPSHSFQCAHLKIPLPDRTVFQGMTDYCSPFYRTYIQENQFVSYYQVELAKLKEKTVISDFQPLASSPGFLIHDGKESFQMEYKKIDDHSLSNQSDLLASIGGQPLIP